MIGKQIIKMVKAQSICRPKSGERKNKGLPLQRYRALCQKSRSRRAVQEEKGIEGFKVELDRCLMVLFKLFKSQFGQNSHSLYLVRCRMKPKAYTGNGPTETPAPTLFFLALGYIWICLPQFRQMRINLCRPISNPPIAPIAAPSKRPAGPPTAPPTIPNRITPKHPQPGLYLLAACGSDQFDLPHFGHLSLTLGRSGFATYPQCGQDGALSDISLSHSGQLISAIT